jgi:parvulin-like peptidyl-prolyl isomerase
MSLKSFFISLSLALCLFACATPPDQSVLAKVDGEKIRVWELKKSFKEQKANYGSDILNDPGGVQAIKKNLLNSLIEKRLLLHIAEEKNIHLTDDEESQMIIRLKAGYSDRELQKMLSEKKTTMDDWVEEQKEKKIIEKLLQQEVYSQIVIPQSEEQNYYKKFKSSFREPDRVRCRHIVTSKMDKAKTILSLLDNGANFAAVAQQYSESPDRENGGDLGFIAAGDYPPIFEAACFTLATGQTSDVIPSEYGFHIFRVVEKKPGHSMTFEEAQPQIEKTLKDLKGRENLRLWADNLHQNLTRNQKIMIDEKALKAVKLTP